MDGIDLRIAGALAEDGRCSYADLADLVGLSAPATADRVRRLEERGAVRGYSARLDPDAFGVGLTAFVFVTLAGSADGESFRSSVASLPEVVECHHVAGEDDYLLKVHVDGTRGLEAFVSDRLKTLPGISRTRTTVVLSTSFARPLTPYER